MEREFMNQKKGKKSIQMKLKRPKHGKYKLEDMLPRFSRYLLRIPKEMKEDKNRRNI
jgi:hypothetical protein